MPQSADAAIAPVSLEGHRHLVWRVRILNLTDTEILVEHPTTLGQVMDIARDVAMIAILSIGQNRWMFHTVCHGGMTVPQGERRSMPALRLGMPDTVLRCQRRNHYRVEAPLNLPMVDLWPLLIVLLSALLPPEGGEARGLRWWHVAGATLGFAGTVLVLRARPSEAGAASDWIGYGFALGAAVIWSGYSVLSRRFAHVPSTSVTGFCFVTALLALLCHLVLEETVWPQGPGQWAAVIAMGAGPLGLAFYAWDRGVKHGDIRVLGAAAYAAPLLSTLLLVGLGLGDAGPMLWLACLCIVGGAVLAAHEMLFARVRSGREALRRQLES